MFLKVVPHLEDMVLLMNFEEKNNDLKRKIKEALSPLISGDCCLLGLPYFHTNVGDFLIWQGAEELLKDLNVNCIYRASVRRYQQKKIPKNATILLNGGGNFGDTWEGAPALYREIVSAFPNNKIVILPQTVFYKDKEKFLADAELYSRHPNVILCVRDNRSFETLKQHFSNTIVLAPDLAFYIPYHDLSRYEKTNHKGAGKTLFLKRNDRELNKEIDYSLLLPNGADKNNMDVMDWITIDKPPISFLILKNLWRISRRVAWFSKAVDLYAYYCFKQSMIKHGVRQISQYDNVFVTRLHAGILRCLLRKPFALFDNSHGKNSSFFETWFCDLDDAKLYK